MIRSFVVSCFVACSLVSLGCGSPSVTSPPETPARARQAPTGHEPQAPAASSAPAPTSSAPTALTNAAAALVGRWSCSGAIHGPDGAPSASEVRVEVELDLGQAWLRTEFVALSGAHKYDFIAYRTFRPAPSKWLNVSVDNFGGHAVSWSDDGATWTGESSSPMGKLQIRDVETLEASGALKMRGQYSLDGKSWRTGYDLACRR